MTAESQDPRSGAGQHPADLLAAEHQVVLAVLDALDAEVARLRGEGQLRVGLWRDAIDFLAEFVDGTHIQKEEQVLFPALVKCGFPDSPGPVASLRRDHRDQRELLDQIRAALSTGDAAALARSARTYDDFQRDHIAREDNVILEIARQVLRGDDATATRDALQRFDAIEVGDDETARRLRLARRLCTETGVEFDRHRRPPFDERCGHS